MLGHFKNLPPEKIDEEQPLIYTHNLSSSLLSQREACVGANAVMAMGYPPRQLLPDDQCRYWAVDDAPKALGKAYALSPGTLLHRLVQLGAPTEPFGCDYWEVNPYDVFSALYQQRFNELRGSTHNDQ